jgi:hypothetical protein
MLLFKAALPKSSDPSVQRNIAKEAARVCNNQSICCLKMKLDVDAFFLAETAILLDSSWFKPYFTKAQACISRARWADAMVGTCRNFVPSNAAQSHSLAFTQPWRLDFQRRWMMTLANHLRLCCPKLRKVSSQLCQSPSRRKAHKVINYCEFIHN